MRNGQGTMVATATPVQNAIKTHERNVTIVNTPFASCIICNVCRSESNYVGRAVMSRFLLILTGDSIKMESEPEKEVHGECL